MQEPLLLGLLLLCSSLQVNAATPTLTFTSVHIAEGRHWQASRFTDTVGCSLVVSFADAQHGSLLTVSDMASGSTRQGLYRTANGGRTWVFVAKALPDHIDPTGAIFRNHLEGWLTAGYHGNDAVPLYRTNDGGHHWRLQELTIPALYQDGGRHWRMTYPLMLRTCCDRAVNDPSGGRDADRGATAPRRNGAG